MRHGLRLPLLRVACGLALAGLWACGPRVGPAVDYVPPVSGPVGSELRILLRGSASDGRVAFDYDAPGLPDLRKRKLAPSITHYAEGQALFRWIPLAMDVGNHRFDFVAVAAGVETRVAVQVTVTPGTGEPPAFRVPVGEGTILDLNRDECVELDVLVEDPDSAQIDIALEPPPVANANLTQVGPYAARLRFCPSDTQVLAQAIYPLALSASDRVNPKVLKHYTVVVRPRATLNCTTMPPVIDTKQHGFSFTTGNLHIKATLSDDVGIASARVLWTLNPPADMNKPDPSAFSPLPMNRKSGDAKMGYYEGTIPNPVVASPSGTEKTIYYLVVAEDADPPMGCAHESVAPPMGVFSFKVKRP